MLEQFEAEMRRMDGADQDLAAEKKKLEERLNEVMFQLRLCQKRRDKINEFMAIVRLLLEETPR